MEFELANFSEDSCSIEEYYSAFSNLWTEHTDIIYASISSESVATVQAVHEVKKRGQFLMKLRTEFESIRSNIMNVNISQC